MCIRDRDHCPTDKGMQRESEVDWVERLSCLAKGALAVASDGIGAVRTRCGRSALFEAVCDSAWRASRRSAGARARLPRARLQRRERRHHGRDRPVSAHADAHPRDLLS
eukprot:6212755-Pleurochrysis_carterae.AAC.4